MANSSVIPPSIACAEAISLLHLLHPVPAKPSSNPPPSSQDADHGAYALPVALERSLASTLAFLSSVKDDPNRVSALFIHEDSSTRKLNVLIAVNQARHGDGYSYLQTIEVGFKRIFKSLSKVLESENAECEIFSGIVSMCSRRILSRMRFVPHKRNKPRQTFDALLQETVNLLGAQFPDFRHNAQALIKLVNLWAKHQTEQRLSDVITAVLQLSRTSDLTQLLGSIPNHRMGPSERNNLLKIVKSVARYREAARFLYCLAKKHIIARSMKAVLTSLPQSAFSRPCPGYSPDLDSVFARLDMMGSQYDLNRISYLLNSNGALAKNRFAEQCTRTLSEGKVHAEMQLIYYCETIKPFPPPRVIASSKMACFLCNAFICHMTKLHTRRCHGRLYPGWKMPVFALSTDLERRFAQKLESQIKSSVKTLLSRQKRTSYPQPSESTLWTMESLATTIDVAGEDGKSCLDRAIELESDGELACNGSAAMQPRLRPDANREPEMKMSASLTPGLEKEVPLTESSVPSNVYTAARHRTQVHRLQRGGPISTAVRSGHSSALFETRPLRLQIEYDIGQNYSKPEKGEAQLDCSIEWLTQRDAKLVMEDETRMIISAESLDSALPISIRDENGLYISARGDLLKLRFGKGRTE